MQFGAVPLADATGKILAHKLIAPDGRRLFNKGHVLRDADLAVLHEAGFAQVIVAALGETDLDENEAAERVGRAVLGAGLQSVAPGVGRANITALIGGVVRINVAALERINMIDEGITIATLREHTLVQPGQMVALVKIIPFGIARARVEDVEAVAQEAAPVLAVRGLQPRRVTLIVAAPPMARDDLLARVVPAVQTRVERLGSALMQVQGVDHEPLALMQAIRVQASSSDLVLVASISATIDREDVVPVALRAAGGSVAHFGAPVDPGSLLMLGYLAHTPVIGMPGCVRSLKTNVVDLILPRLLAGERLTRADLVAMGHGGLLEDISERPMPRQFAPNEE